MKRLAKVLVLLVSVLAGIVVIRGMLLQPKEREAVRALPLADRFSLAADRLAGAIRHRTVSVQDTGQVDSAAFLGLHDYLRSQYRRVFGELEVETISDLSLLLTWRGRRPELSPVLIMGHLDVVPAEEDSLWAHPPFEGARADGFVWGRGAVDDKVGVIAALEAAESLVEGGFRPERTVYFAFGHDEEAGGARGAAVIADTLSARVSGKLAFVIDEGGFIGDGLLEGLDAPVALIGVAEKGYLSLELTASGDGGHSSAPPALTAVGRVSRAVARVVAEPFPARIDGATRAMFDHVAPHMGLGRRIVFANLWLFSPLVKSILTADQGSATLVRTTTAATMMSGGVKENVLPTAARAVVNFRILPGETTETVIEQVRVVVDDSLVGIRPINVYFDPSPVSDPASPVFGLLQRTIRQTAAVEDLIITPFLVPGATDSRYFTPLSDHVYRFLPIVVQREVLETIHGSGERISEADVRSCAAFLYRLVEVAGGVEGTGPG